MSPAIETETDKSALTQAILSIPLPKSRIRNDYDIYLYVGVAEVGQYLKADNTDKEPEGPGVFFWPPDTRGGASVERGGARIGREDYALALARESDGRVNLFVAPPCVHPFMFFLKSQAIEDVRPLLAFLEGRGWEFADPETAKVVVF